MALISRFPDSKPIYGADNSIPSCNFKDLQWVRFEGEEVIDPYSILPKLFEDMPDDIDELLSDDDEIASGGAAMTVYAKMQFTEMSIFERTSLRAALLQYCELDTLAMVMIYEAWNDWANQ